MANFFRYNLKRGKEGRIPLTPCEALGHTWVRQNPKARLVCVECGTKFYRGSERDSRRLRGNRVRVGVGARSLESKSTKQNKVH